MRPLQPQDDAFAAPGRGNLHATPIPGRAAIMLLRLQEERHLDVAGLPVFRVLRAFEPGLRVDLPIPFGVKRDVVAKTLVLQRAGQLDALVQRALEPAPRDARIRAVQMELPLAGQRNAVRLGCRGLPVGRADACGNYKDWKCEEFTWDCIHLP